MRIRKVRQILKAFSDDNRIRIINLLNSEDLSVTELCRVLNRNQSNISKHLTRLRLTGIAGDRREGINIYYYLIRPKEGTQKKLISAITAGLADLEIFKGDLKRLREIRKKSTAR